jgi:hypothetical protein
MKRLSSQLIITESAEILRNSIVQITDVSISYHNILDENHETAHTVFYDGIISLPIISLTKRGINKSEIENCGYILIPFENFIKEKNVEDKKIIIDFGTEDLLIINSLLKKNNRKLNHFDSCFFIIACTVSPYLFLENTNKTSDTRILWSGTNLIDKKITGQTFVSIV